MPKKENIIYNFRNKREFFFSYLSQKFGPVNLFFIPQFFLNVLFVLIGSQHVFSAQHRSEYSFKKVSSSFENIKPNKKEPYILKFAQAPSESGSSTPLSTCKKEDFESVVDKAAQVLRDLNFKNKPQFQDKLKQLKEKHGWPEALFEKEAARFVKDEEIDRLDNQTLDLLAKITAMGDQGSAANLPDCSLLETLQKYMKDLIDTQSAKWAYIFKKIDAETTKEQ